jgi:hypothetical protein
MRPAAYYYLAQAWPARRTRQDQPAAPSRARSRGRHARPPARAHAWRELPAAARRALAVLSGASPAA